MTITGGEGEPTAEDMARVRELIIRFPHFEREPEPMTEDKEQTVTWDWESAPDIKLNSLDWVIRQTLWELRQLSKRLEAIETEVRNAR